MIHPVQTFFGVAAMFAISACGALEAPQTTLTVSGPVTTDSKGGQNALFLQAYGAAYEVASLTASARQTDDARGSQDRYRQMAVEGFGVIKGNCSDFFSRRGDVQQVIAVTRDVAAVGAATAATIVGLTGGSTLALSIIALSGATLYSGLDVYTKNFLFASDNIENVRTLTLNALDVHSTAVLKDNSKWSFQNSAGALLDNQELCKPAKIAAMARQAIQNGKLDPVKDTDNFATAFDGTLKQLIGSTAGLGGGGVPSDVQLAALCWAANTSDPKTEAEDAAIKRLLPAQPFFKGPSAPNWAFNAVAVQDQCAKLSEATRSTIRDQIAAMKDAAKQSAGTGPAATAAVMARAATVAPPPTTSSSGPAGSKHFSIRVR